jgi:hypothetical protein
MKIYIHPYPTPLLSSHSHTHTHTAMAGIALTDFTNTPTILFHVGPNAFFGWFYHFINLSLYTLLYNTFKDTKGSKALSPKLRYRWDRQIENWQFGSGLDYTL